MTKREKYIRKVLQMRARLEPPVRRIFAKGLIQVSAHTRELLRAGELEAIRYAEYPRAPLVKAMTDAYVKVGVPFAKQAEEAIIKATFDKDYWIRIFEEYVRFYMGHRIDVLIDYYEETIWKRVGDAILKGQTEGMSYKQIADELMDELDTLDGKLAMRLARTESVAASNYANMEVIKQQGFAETTIKRWNTVIDNRTHPTHVDAHGQEVKLNDKFYVGGYACDAPASYELPTEERDWCRCVVTYEMTDTAWYEQDE